MSLQRKTLAEMLTFTRAGTATYFGSDGLLKTAAANEPRFDYDPATLQPRGLLVEGSRTNVLLRSEEFSSAEWVKVGSTISANVAVAPNGATTADKLVENTTTGAHLITQSASVISGTTYTYSIFAKASERSVIQINANTGFALSAFRYNLTTGAVTTVTGTATAKIEAVGGGWYRCSITATANSTGTGQAFNTLLTDGTTSSYTGDGTSGTFIWGAQLTAGAFTTSYIPTTTAAVTRAADSVVMTGAQFSDWFNQSEGTFVVEFNPITNGLTNTGANDFEYVYDVDSAAAPTSNHILAVSAAYGPGVRAQTELAGVNQAALTSAATLGTGASLRQAYAYKANDFAGSFNGAAVLTDTSGTLPTPDRMAIGSQNGGASGHFDGHIRRIRYWPNRLSNVLLQEATA